MIGCRYVTPCPFHFSSRQSSESWNLLRSELKLVPVFHKPRSVCEVLSKGWILWSFLIHVYVCSISYLNWSHCLYWVKNNFVIFVCWLFFLVLTTKLHYRNTCSFLVQISRGVIFATRLGTAWSFRPTITTYHLLRLNDDERRRKFRWFFEHHSCCSLSRRTHLVSTSF